MLLRHGFRRDGSCKLPYPGVSLLAGRKIGQTLGLNCGGVFQGCQSIGADHTRTEINFFKRDVDALLGRNRAGGAVIQRLFKAGGEGYKIANLRR